jgi:hypothetical protein
MSNKFTWPTKNLDKRGEATRKEVEAEIRRVKKETAKQSKKK